MSGIARNIEIRRNSSGAPWAYADLDQRQRIVAAEARAGGTGALLVSEVAPVITLGRRARRELEITASDAQLAERDVSLYVCERGGLATWHGPGQWVLFAVDRLERLSGDPRGVRAAVEGLLEIARDTARLWAPEAEIREGAMTGVWGARGKIASVGVQIQEGVLLHGLAINCVKTPSSFYGLRPCGLDVAVQYLLEPTASEAEFLRVRDELVDRAIARFPNAFSEVTHGVAVENLRTDNARLTPETISAIS